VSEDKNSMLYWWPRVEDVCCPKPATRIVRVRRLDLGWLEGGGDREAFAELVEGVRKAVDRLGVPAFLRTDHFSAKHSYERTCFYDGSNPLAFHILQLIEESELASIIGLPVGAIVVRRFIPLESAFRAFWGRLPIARERRYFVVDGEVVCHHPYWPVDAIERSSGCELPSNWRSLLADLNRESDDEVELLSGYARSLGERLPGAWSLDFARGRNGTWYFIDAAVAEDSWHPPCERWKEVMS